MIGAIVLAAGRSQRMGTQKLLLPLGENTLIGHIVAEVRGAPVDKIIVVVGVHADEVGQQFAKQAVALVTNPDPAGEMLSSIRCGLRTLPQECEAAMIVLGDQPGIHAQLVRELIATFRSSGRGIVMPACRGKRGHPTLIAAKYFHDILNQYDNVGLHGLLAAHPEDIEEFEIADAGVLEDMDHPADYQRARERHGRGVNE